MKIFGLDRYDVINLIEDIDAENVEKFLTPDVCSKLNIELRELQGKIQILTPELSKTVGASKDDIVLFIENSTNIADYMSDELFSRFKLDIKQVKKLANKYIKERIREEGKNR